jgi:predicted metal-dependent phosphoesterase TrpH
MAAAALAAIERHPHLAQPCPSGWVRVDMHSHTMFSGDSTTTLDEIVESVVEAGIDVLCVTDHNAIEGAVRLQKALDGVCRVIAGEEVRTHTGEIIGLLQPRFVNRAASSTSRIRSTRCVATSLKSH